MCRIIIANACIMAYFVASIANYIACIGAPFSPGSILLLGKIRWPWPELWTELVSIPIVVLCIAR